MDRRAEGAWKRDSHLLKLLKPTFIGTPLPTLTSRPIIVGVGSRTLTLARLEALPVDVAEIAVIAVAIMVNITVVVTGAVVITGLLRHRENTDEHQHQA